MEAVLTKRVDELVSNGWQPVTTTETTASLVGRRPFAWWLFLFVLFFFPLFGGLLYLIFWLATSKATVFLHVEGDEVVVTGDNWLIQLQDAQRDAARARTRTRREMKKSRMMALVLGWCVHFPFSVSLTMTSFCRTFAFFHDFCHILFVCLD